MYIFNLFQIIYKKLNLDPKFFINIKIPII